MAPNGNPSGSLFYLMIAVPTQATPVPGIPPHMYSDADESTRSPQLNQALKKKLWVFLDRDCTNGRPLYVTGGGVFISDQPICWKDIRSACTFDQQHTVYDRDLKNKLVRQDCEEKTVIRCGGARDEFVPIVDSRG